MSADSTNPFEDSRKALINDLIRSHYQLPPEELSSLLASLSGQLSKCDEELARLRAKIDELGIHRAVLQEQYDSCQSFFAPVRRLPSEIIAEIFALAAVNPEPTADTPPSLALLQRLAHPQLLILSRVCARWHSVAVGTPSLWTKIHLQDTAFWSAPGIAERAMELLQSALARSGNFPLTVIITNTTNTWSHRPALELLAQHSARWRVVRFRCPASDFQFLAAAKGNLAILENIEVATNASESLPVTLFEVAPRLRRFAMAQPLGPHVSTPPLDQILNLRCFDLASTDIADTVSAMSDLSGSNSFSLHFYLDDWSRSAHPDLAIAHTSSDVGRLAIELTGEFFKHHCQQALGSIFAGLTLPRLKGLTFESENYPRFPLVWPHAQFLALCQRSSFHAHLQSLSLHHVHITEPQLLQCLAVLPALTALSIADHERIRMRGVNLDLISNTLLVALTSTPAAPCLIPQLQTLSLRSRLRFNDRMFLDMVLSRLQPGRRFECGLGIVPHGTASRRMDDEVVVRLRELVVQGDLTMSLLGSQ
ncbi:hypothetical protein B0H14DRAFT_3464940 [Mycena olivaceomarginata]|nr:hypothetical protein B0H14DRAFT_3464940 [Mycena olivaceomarginata]